jgi:lysophospholipid acyltransferase 1/2
MRKNSYFIHLIDRDVIDMQLHYRLYYMWFTGLLKRSSYYVAWLLADLVCNSSGLGFNGYDVETGNPQWNLSTSVDIPRFEVCIYNFKEYYN